MVCVSVGNCDRFFAVSCFGSVLKHLICINTVNVQKYIR